MFADLHTHSIASDGTKRPSEVVRLAKEHDLNAIALTDHDTIDGVKEAIESAQKHGIEVIPGIELNSNDGEQDVHILGYFINYNDEIFKKKLDTIIKLRVDRGKQIIEKLNEINIDISIEDVLEFTNEKFIGRPHIARAMVKKGYAETVKDAFDKFIGEGGPAFVKRYILHPFESIHYIIENGAVPVLAHPALLKNNNIIEELVKNGLMGIEVYHSKHSSSESEYYLKKAKEFGLLITGGSDFHGIEVDGKQLLGTVKLDYKFVELLKYKSKNTVEIR